MASQWPHWTKWFPQQSSVGSSPQAMNASLIRDGLWVLWSFPGNCRCCQRIQKMAFDRIPPDLLARTFFPPLLLQCSLSLGRVDTDVSFRAEPSQSPSSAFGPAVSRHWLLFSAEGNSSVRGRENQSISAAGSPASWDFIFYIFMYLLHYASIWMLILSWEEGLRNHLNILGEAWCRNGPHEVFLPNTGMCRVEALSDLSSFWEDEWMKRSGGYDGCPGTFPKDDRWAE